MGIIFQRAHNSVTSIRTSHKVEESAGLANAHNTFIGGRESIGHTLDFLKQTSRIHSSNNLHYLAKDGLRHCSYFPFEYQNLLQSLSLQYAGQQQTINTCFFFSSFHVYTDMFYDTDNKLHCNTYF